MMSVTFHCTVVPRYLSCDDIRDEMHNVFKLGIKRDTICRSLERWRNSLEQNNYQLDILHDTSVALQKRHKTFADALARGTPLLRDDRDFSVFLSACREVNTLKAQVQVWMRELGQLRENRHHIQLKHTLENLRLRTDMQRSLTNIELAHIDCDFLQNCHYEMWKGFLCEKTSQKDAPQDDDDHSTKIGQEEDQMHLEKELMNDERDRSSTSTSRQSKTDVGEIAAAGRSAEKQPPPHQRRRESSRGRCKSGEKIKNIIINAKSAGIKQKPKLQNPETSLTRSKLTTKKKPTTTIGAENSENRDETMQRGVWPTGPVEGIQEQEKTCLEFIDDLHAEISS